LAGLRSLVGLGINPLSSGGENAMGQWPLSIDDKLFLGMSYGLRLSGREQVKLPARERRASGETPSGTPPKPPGFALRATPRSPLAIPLRAVLRMPGSRSGQIRLPYTQVRNTLQTLSPALAFYIWRAAKSWSFLAIHGQKLS